MRNNPPLGSKMTPIRPAFGASRQNPCSPPSARARATEASKFCHFEIDLPRRGDSPLGLELECATGRSIADLEQGVTVRPVLELHRVGDAPVEERGVSTLRRTHGAGGQLAHQRLPGPVSSAGSVDPSRLPQANDYALLIAEHGRARDAWRLAGRCNHRHLQSLRRGRSCSRRCQRGRRRATGECRHAACRRRLNCRRKTSSIRPRSAGRSSRADRRRSPLTARAAVSEARRSRTCRLGGASATLYRRRARRKRSAVDSPQHCDKEPYT